MMRFLRVSVVLGLSTLAAQAQYVDGNNLHRWCQAQNKVSAPYVLGVYDAIMINSRIYPTSSRFCVPLSVTREQINDVVCKYTADNPQERHWEAAAVVLKAPAVRG